MFSKPLIEVNSQHSAEAQRAATGIAAIFQVSLIAPLGAERRESAQSAHLSLTIERLATTLCRCGPMDA
jgi:hypothetical protein